MENQLLVFGQDARVAWENSMHDSMELPFGVTQNPYEELQNLLSLLEALTALDSSDRGCQNPDPFD